MKSNSRISLVVAASLTVLGGTSTPALADNASAEPVPTSGAEWFRAGRTAVEANKLVNRELNTRRAKNVILFVGDGMGVSTVTAARILERFQQRFHPGRKRLPGLRPLRCAQHGMKPDFHRRIQLSQHASARRRQPIG